jgi:hypothetical protein
LDLKSLQENIKHDFKDLELKEMADKKTSTGAGLQQGVIQGGSDVRSED